MTLLVCCALSAQDSPAKVYDESLNPMTQIDQAVAQAKDEAIRQVVEENFVYIHVNYHPRKSGEAGKAMLKRLGNAGRFGYHVLVVLNGEGQVVHIQDSGLLEEGKSYNQTKVLDFFKHWTPKAVNSAD